MQSNKYLTLAILSIIVFLFCFTSCSTQKPTPLPTEVNLQKFMGDWFVIANIPTYFEKDAYSAIESYKLSDTFETDRKILTTFTFLDGSFTGKKKTYNPTAFVQNDPSNAVWKMQFIWPLKADYRIIYVDPKYQETIIGRNKRDYLWIMARTPQISASRYQSLIAKVVEAGYDKELVKLVPQSHQ